MLPPTLPPDIDVEVWSESIELVRRWRASTLLVTHFGAHEDPGAHLDATQTHLTAMTDIARECISAGGDASAQQSRCPLEDIAVGSRAVADGAPVPGLDASVFQRLDPARRQVHVDEELQLEPTATSCSSLRHAA